MTVRRLESDETYDALTDSFGDFYIRNLETGGPYRVEISANGYENEMRVVEANKDCDLGTITLKRI